MMRLLLCLYDAKAESFNAPFAVPSLGVAYRNLADEVAKVGDPNNVLALHASDFELYDCGRFDDEVGVIEAYKQPKLVCRLIDLKVSAD